jgi:Aldehyde dehydrogenase family
LGDGSRDRCGKLPHSCFCPDLREALLAFHGDLFAPHAWQRIQTALRGPVVCAMPFKDADEVAAEMNRTSYGLAGAFGPQTSEAPRAAGKRLGENAFAASLVLAKGFCEIGLSSFPARAPARKWQVFRQHPLAKL